MKHIDPYRVFFPIGLFYGLMGVALWIPWLITQTGVYPGEFHPEIMIGGFLLTYSLGFLTTAIPRFTESKLMQTNELILALCLTVVAGIAFLTQNKLFIYFSDLSIFSFLIYFALSRFRSRKKNPPPSFIFIGLAFLIGLISLGALIFTELYSPNELILRRLNSPFFNCFMLTLVLGVGSRLIPALLGHEAPPDAPTDSKTENKIKNIQIEMFFYCFVFFISFCLDILNIPIIWGDALRAFVTVSIGLRHWKLARKPRQLSVFSAFLWLSAWSVLLGTTLPVLAPTLRIHSIHLLFISGLGLMTLIISTRVTLAHANLGNLIHTWSWPLLSSCCFILLAALLRVTVSIYPDEMIPLYLGACASWCAGLLIWLAHYHKVLFNVEAHKASH